jgi:hypothetical protein
MALRYLAGGFAGESLLASPLSSRSKIALFAIRNAWAEGSPVKTVFVEATVKIPCSAEQ